MRQRGQGKILITGSIAGFIPGSFQAVYNGTKAFVDSFSTALRNELKDTGVTVTCLMPGPTETEFFERAELMDTKVGQEEKADPAKVAVDGYAAMRSEEHTSELQSLMRTSYAVFCLKNKKKNRQKHKYNKCLKKLHTSKRKQHRKDNI